MKNILFIIALFLFYATTINAQTELWGMMSEGGKYGVGAIYKTDGDGNNFEVQYNFFKTVGATNQTALTETPNGKLYGIASDGAVCENYGGVLYEYNISTDSYDIKYSFEDDENGNYPIGNLVYATNDKLYGITSRGGIPDDNSGKGVIFEFDLSTNTYTKIFDFEGVNGKTPSSLMQAKDGKLYGTTSYGGTDDKGLIFSYDITNSSYNVLYEFTGGLDGYRPHGAFVETSDGVLYGVTSSGGANGGGIIYEFNIATSTITVKASLSTYNIDLGGSPSGLVMNTNGKLYGVSHYTDKTDYIFEYDIDTETYALKHTINSSKTYTSYKTLLSADNGKLYGSGSNIGNYSDGTIFEYNIDDNLLTTIYNFDENNIPHGYFPNAPIIQASNGKLYSTTNSGGRSESYSDGVLYEFDITNDTYSPKFNFEESLSGYAPKGKLTQATNGKLYGLTEFGGITSDVHTDGMGILFEYNPSSKEYTALVKFDETKGIRPMGSLFQADNGKLYGLTYQGGTTNWGAMFEYNITTSTYNVLYNFDINGDRENGSSPRGTLMQADNGDLYGFTSRGGVLEGGTRVDNGTIFKYNIVSETFTTIHTFDDNNGKLPYSKLIQSTNGLLYGLTTKGGGYSKYGTLFNFDIDTETFTRLYSFSTSEYYNPLGALTEVVKEVLIDDITEERIFLYGVTSANAGDNDAIFAYDITEDVMIFEKEFEGNDSYNPLYTTLLLASNGHLYGAGPIKDTDYKFMFQYNIENNSLESKFDFTCKKNSNVPLYVGELIEIDATYLSAEKHEEISEEASFVYPNPTTGYISINSDVEVSSIEIYNQLGQLVSSNFRKQSIDISNLNSGIYIIRLSDKNGTIRTQKIIKK